MKKDFLSPKLRLIQGDCFVGNDKNKSGQPKTDKSGNPVTTWFIAAAGQKGVPDVEAFKTMIEQEARMTAPQWFNPDGSCKHPKFAFKIMDGDGIDDDGKPNANKPGMAGHWVFKFSSNYAPRCFQAGKYMPQDMLQYVPGGVNPIPRGDYIHVSGTMEFNSDNAKPGMYVNLGMVVWVGLGERIISGPDAATVFAGIGAPGGVPQPVPGYGAIAAPVAPGMPPQPPGVAPTPPLPVAAVTYQPAPQYAAQNHTVESLRAAAPGKTDAELAVMGWLVAVAAPVAPPANPIPPQPPVAPVPVQPHPAALMPPAAPLPPGSAPTPPAPAPTAAATGGAPPGFRMTEPGAQYAAYLAQNWNDALLIQHGKMAPL